MKVTYEVNMPADCWSCRLASRLCVMSMCACRNNIGQREKPEYCMLKQISEERALLELEEAQIEAAGILPQLELMGAVKK